MADLNKNQKFNQFSEKSKELIRSMGNTEYFELCEITCKLRANKIRGNSACQRIGVIRDSNAC